MPSRLLSDKQLEFVTEGPDGFAPKNHWNYKNNISKNLNSGLPQLLRHLPDLVRFIDKDHLQDQITGADLGIGLGQLLTDEQRQDLIASLLLAEKQPDESTAAFLARVPELLEDSKTDISQATSGIRQSGEITQFIYAIASRFEDQLAATIDAQRATSDITIAISNERVKAWLKTQHDPETRPDIPELVTELYGPWDNDIGGKFRTCRTILMSLGIYHNVDSTRPQTGETIKDQWGVRIPPRDEDTEQYLAVLDALDDELEALVSEYFKTQAIQEKDQILLRTVEELERLDRPRRDILEMDTLDASKPEWHGTHTERANNWTTQRDPPVLTRTTDRNQGKVWAWTPYGTLVKRLYELDVDRAELETTGIPTTIEPVLTTAISSTTAEHDSTKSSSG